MKTNRTNAEIITAENIFKIASGITIKALATNYAKSGNAKMRELYNDACAFAKSASKTNGADGADLVQTTACYLSQYIGKSTEDFTNDGQTTKEGEPITIVRGAFREIRKEIYKHEQKQTKQIYLVDYENEGGIIKIPAEWDVPNAMQFVKINDIIKSLKLNSNQKAILSARMRGETLQAIADKRGVTRQAVKNTLNKIARKYINIYGEISIPTLSKIVEK